MHRLLPAFAFVFLFTFGVSCTDADGFSKRSGELGAFLLERSTQFGVPSPSTNGLPKLTADWRYKEDKDGFQIYINGDRFEELQSFLSSAFGPPDQSPKTNNFTGTQSVGARYRLGLGAVLSCGWEQTRDGKQFTSVIVVRQLK